MNNEYEIRGEITAIFLESKVFGKLETFISTSDLEMVKKFPNRWYPTKARENASFYVQGDVIKNGVKTTNLLHRWIMCPDKGMCVDHINHNGLDNTSTNLRIVTNAENLQNRKQSTIKSKSGVRGVAWHKNYQKWQATIRLNGKQMFFGYFDDVKEAEKAVIEARKKYMPFAN